MSINYHAYQNRNILFGHHEKLSEEWKERFSNYDPSRVQKILSLKTDEKYLYISYLTGQFRLSLADGILEKRQEDFWIRDTYFNESMSVYHVLYYVSDHPRKSGRMVRSTAFEHVSSTRAAMPDLLFESFCRVFSGKIELLEQCCQSAGGKRVSGGDAAYEFHIFPFISMQLVFWDLEEDFPAQVQILVDEQITDYVHAETIGCMTADLFDTVLKYNKK